MAFISSHSAPNFVMYNFAQLSFLEMVQEKTEYFYDFPEQKRISKSLFLGPWRSGHMVKSLHATE
jgi:hypothetical protein